MLFIEPSNGFFVSVLFSFNSEQESLYKRVQKPSFLIRDSFYRYLMRAHLFYGKVILKDRLL